MKFNRLLIALCIITIGIPSAFAQKSIMITGKVEDDSTKHPIRSVRVTLRSLPDSILIKGVMTTAQGTFSIPAPQNQIYTLELRRVGFAPYHQRISVLEDNISLQTIRLKESAILTGDIEVFGWREFTEVHPDKSIYSVKDNPNVVATTVSEVLDQIPAVQVDENGAIKLRGDDNVIIMINDRPLTMDAEQRNKMLQQLPSMNIKAIEVRTAPGAKYDAKFSGGIINIVMDKGLSDYIGGNVYLGGSTIEARNTGGTFYYNDSTITASLNLGAYHGIYNSTTAFVRNNSLVPALKYLHKTVYNEGFYTGYYSNPQIDFNLSQNDVLSFSGGLNYNPGGKSSSNGNGNRSDANNIITQFIKDSSANTRISDWMNLSVLYKHQFGEDHKIAIDFNHSNWSSTMNDYKNSPLFSPTYILDSVNSLQQNFVAKESNPVYNLKLDYSYAPSKDITIELGHKTEIENHHSDVVTNRFNYFTESYQNDSLQTLNISPHNSLYAFYSNFGYSFTDDISMQAGVRYEYAALGATFVDSTVERTYPNLFPSASISWKISNQYQITANYNRSIQLPWINILNPRTSRENATSQSKGNPNIRPEFTHSIELTANAFLGSTTITFSPYYKRTVDDIRLNSELIGDIYTNSYTNFNGVQTIGFDGTVNYRTKTGFSARANFSIENYKNIGGSTSSDFATKSTFASINGSVSYEFIKGFTLNANGRYMSPYIIGGEHTLSYFFMNFSAIYKMFDNALTINLMAADPFNLQERQRINSGYGFSVTSDSKPLSRYLNLNVSYSFGKRVNLEQHTIEKAAPRGDG
jgi:outer membrane receptor protein involved in Fe transport